MSLQQQITQSQRQYDSDISQLKQQYTAALGRADQMIQQLQSSNQGLHQTCQDTQTKHLQEMTRLQAQASDDMNQLKEVIAAKDREIAAISQVRPEPLVSCIVLSSIDGFSNCCSSSLIRSGPTLYRFHKWPDSCFLHLLPPFLLRNMPKQPRTCRIKSSKS